MDPRTDGELLTALQRGDRHALTELVERHQRVLLGHARALVGDGGRHEDIVQEVYLKLLERPPQIPPERLGDPEAERALLRAWLHTVTRNCCMDSLRSDSRRRARESSAATQDIARPSHVGGAVAVEQRDTRAAVERGLAKLPQDQREVLVLRLLGERSYKDIAEITGKKIGTVGWLISEGLKALAGELAPLADGVNGRGAKV
ncbi:MAG: RNA polymerase sigma factor [Planctomycetes bacterium]|jgi:RNA polymerase sigma-70 factor (ECF subfamily)|nr:RNA polymerase sigma factor [Planctomycetota bacterium]